MTNLLKITVVLFTVALFFGCEAEEPGVTDVSRETPYKSFIGKFVASKDSGSIWTNSLGSYELIRGVSFIRPASWGGVDSYRIELRKLVDYPSGTRFKIDSFKHRQVRTEIGGYDGILVVCTAFLADGQGMKCQIKWIYVVPDPRNSASEFALVDK